MKPTKTRKLAVRGKVTKKTPKIRKQGLKAAKPINKSKHSKVVSALTNEAKRRAEKLDKILLKLAPGPYTQILKQIETGKRRIDEERRLALQLGTRILEKAKEVRDSLPLPRTRPLRG